MRVHQASPVSSSSSDPASEAAPWGRPTAGGGAAPPNSCALNASYSSSELPHSLTKEASDTLRAFMGKEVVVPGSPRAACVCR